MKKEKEKNVWQQYVGFAFLILVGAACGLAMVLYLDQPSAEKPLYREILTLLALFLGLYAAFFFHLTLHEAGHLLFGLMSGYTFSSFRIGSFMWIKENGKLKLKRLSIAGTGGQCLMAPPDLKDGKIPLVLYNLGGSIVNLLIGALFLAAYFLCPEILILSPLLFIFAIAGFATALLNGIPMRMGAVDNDGYNAFALSKNKEAVEAFWVQLKTVEQSAKGIRLKDMPDEWFVFPSDAAMKNSMVATRGVFACNRLMDAEKYAEADTMMAHMLSIESGMVGLHRSLLICDRMFIELIGEKRSDVIENMLTKEQKQFMKAMKRFPSVLRTEYALALLFEKDAAKAEKVKAEFEKVAKSYPYVQDVDSERDLLRLAESKAKEKFGPESSLEVLD